MSSAFSSKNYFNESEKYRKEIGKHQENIVRQNTSSRNSQSKYQEKNSRILGSRQTERSVYKRHYFLLFLFLILGGVFIFFLLSFIMKSETI